ncbi:MAG: hypothetical protein AMXMBFR36_06680 [Acidobacteriota bacterium]
MDPQRVKDVYERLELLDDRLGHRLRARGGPARATPEQLEEKVRDLSEFASELRSLVKDLIVALTARPPA